MKALNYHLRKTRLINHRRWIREQSEAAKIITTNFYLRWCHLAALAKVTFGKSALISAIPACVWVIASEKERKHANLNLHTRCAFSQLYSSSSFSRYSFFLCNFYFVFSRASTKFIIREKCQQRILKVSEERKTCVRNISVEA